MDNDINSYQSLMNTDTTLSDISNLTQQLQIIQSYFIQNPNYIIYSDGSSNYLKNTAIQDNTIDESKIINLTTDLSTLNGYINTLNSYFSNSINPLYILLHNGNTLQYINNNYIDDATINQSKIINLTTDLSTLNGYINTLNSYFTLGIINNTSLSTILSLINQKWTSLNYPKFGSTSNMFCNLTFEGSSTTTNYNYYLISPSNLFSMIIETPQNANFNFIVNSQTSSQYKARIYFDKLATSTYLDFDQLLNAINITGTLRNNSSTLSASNAYEYITKYYSDLTYQPLSSILTSLNNAGWGTNNYILKTNGTNTLSFVDITSLYTDNTISYNKLGTKTNNYAFICTDSTHANITEVLLNSTTNVNNYISSACIDYTRLTPINDVYTITSAYNNAFNINFNNTFSTTNNFIYHNINITNSTYGVKTYAWIYNVPNANYCTLDLLIDGPNNYFSCTGNTSSIYNGSSYNKGVIVSQWFKANNILSNNTSTSISSFAPYECLTKGVCEARYAIAGSPTTFAYNTNFVRRSEGYYYKTYAGSYSDHTYFISSNSNSSPAIGTSYSWSSLVSGGGTSNYICEFRTLLSNSSTTSYINSSGSYIVGSSRKIKDNIIKYDDVNKNDLDILDIIKNIKISIFDYSKKEKPQNEEIHDNFKKKLIKESPNETGIIIEDLEDYYKICKSKNKNKTCDIFDSMITYDHRWCDKQNDTLKCNTNDGQYCQKFLAYNGIYNLNVHATKQLINKVEELENKINELTKLVNNLMNKV